LILPAHGLFCDTTHSLNSILAVEQKNIVTGKLALGLAGLSLVVVAGVGFNPANAWATAGKKVDCDKVMSEVQAGKKTKDIAKDLSISNSSIYKCKKRASVAAGAPKKVVASSATAPAVAPATAPVPK
jgi:hypothetical protein